MGCFLACFGIKTRKKRRSSSKKSSFQEQNHGSYVPLDSDISIKLDIKENHFASQPNHNKEKPKEPSILKIKKKVSFNLNVKAYEPIPEDEDIGTYLSEGEEETRWEFNTETRGMTSLHFEEDSISYPPNHRYGNCRDSYDDLHFDEIEDIDEDEDDIYSNESDDDCDDDDEDDMIMDREDLAWKSNEEESRNLEHLLELQEKELEGFRSKFHARDRGQYVSSVLNPVENLTQWKSVKAKSAAPKLKCQKENLVTNHLSNSQAPGQKIAVDASLSNWLGSNRIVADS